MKQRTKKSDGFAGFTGHFSPMQDPIPKLSQCGSNDDSMLPQIISGNPSDCQNSDQFKVRLNVYLRYK